MKDEYHRWSISVYARNEGRRLERCLYALGRADKDPDTEMTLMLNGTGFQPSANSATRILSDLNLPFRIYCIRVGDKSNAWNQFVYKVRPSANTYFFVDGYTLVNKDALAELAKYLDQHPEANAAAAIPAIGSAPSIRNRMLAEGEGLVGALFALRGTFIERLVSRGIRLPFGLYRSDGLIRSMVSHNLDPQTPWLPVALVPAATFQLPRRIEWGWEYLARSWRRRVQQGRGRLENESIKEIIYTRGYEALPDDTDEMITDWVRRAPHEHRPKFLRDFFAALALLQVKQRSREKPPTDISPLPYSGPGEFF